MAKEDSSNSLFDLKAASSETSHDALSVILNKKRFSTKDISEALVLTSHNIKLPLHDPALRYATLVNMKTAGAVSEFENKTNKDILTTIEKDNDSLTSNVSQLEDFAPKTSAPQIQILKNEVNDVRVETNSLFDNIEQTRKTLDKLIQTQKKPLTDLLEEYVNGKKSKDEVKAYLKPIYQDTVETWDKIDPLVKKQKDISAQQKKLFQQSNVLAEEHKIPMKQAEEAPRLR